MTPTNTKSCDSGLTNIYDLADSYVGFNTILEHPHRWGRGLDKTTWQRNL
jgi:hypothetical protein